jgi:hypothetical protein
LISARVRNLALAAVLPIAFAPSSLSAAPHRTATIHWQNVPLSEAIRRLKPLFNDAVFADRRVDPSTRLTLDIEASSAEDVVAAVALGHNWQEVRLNKVVYLGPDSAGSQLRAIAAERAGDVARMSAGLRTVWTTKEGTSWPRLIEPRTLISELVGKRDWHIGNPGDIPHDLWAAGELPEMPLAEQLSLLLIGFDLTFRLDPIHRTIEIVPLDKSRFGMQSENKVALTLRRTTTPRQKPKGKVVYTLRVDQQPVRAILRQLTERSHWPIEIDEPSIRAAGKSLDTRVSFSVENADQDQLLKAILAPAGLSYRLEGERVRITATGTN